MSADERTIAAYDARAGAYAERFDAAGPDRNLQDFIAALATGARVLDLGCGPGNASAFMRAAGLKPDPIDASAKMVALANARHAIGARLATFDDIGGVGEYEAVWANFSLLHAAAGDLPRYLAALARALKPGGLLHIGMKTGSGAARDRIELARHQQPHGAVHHRSDHRRRDQRQRRQQHRHHHHTRHPGHKRGPQHPG